MSEQRLQKVLAAAGVDSRRKCEELILSGVVRVNRKVVDELPAFVDPEKDAITVLGKKIRAARKVRPSG
jgi:23S rRNA pseudouridine2605 synthase